MAPILDRAAQELEPQARFVKINADDNPELSGRLGVQGIPALFVLKHGSVLAQQSGLTKLATIQNWVRQFSN
jgi:thioredoxin 2